MGYGKFKKKSKAGAAISTASLPDIIFMLLFFFMVTTVLRETELLVEQDLPKATQLTKLERKSLVAHLYVGKPLNTQIYGKEPKVQANDVFVSLPEIVRWVAQEKDKLDEVERDQLTVSLKVDIGTKMGIIVDLQEELREANARKILYNSLKKTAALGG
ncbi:MAG: biopolymer transporter ExbD [Cytophagales bacterium]|nr:biopolymer transporter ExbD [Cytophagales bacterium]